MKCNLQEGLSLLQLEPKYRLNGDFEDYVYKIGADDLLYEYTDLAYKDINNAYRRGIVTEETKALDELFRTEGNHPKYTPVYRGTRISTRNLHKLEQAYYLAKRKEEDIHIFNPAVLSTTTNANIATNYSSKLSVSQLRDIARRVGDYTEATIEILPADKLYDISAFSRYSEENEVLVPPKTIFKVERIKYSSGRVKLSLQTIPMEIRNIVTKTGFKAYGDILSLAGITEGLIYATKGVTDDTLQK